MPERPATYDPSIDQPRPTPRDNATDIQSLVIADIAARREVGIARYGTPLQAHNGRDALRDAYDEALDLACYLRQLLEEQGDGRDLVERISAFNLHQRDGRFHPFTCGNPEHREHITLVAVQDGAGGAVMVCPAQVCGYEQPWISGHQEDQQ